MLRITNTEPRDAAAAFRLEGQLVGPWVGELRAACEKMLADGRSLSIDLGDVSLIDREGFELLGRLSTRGVTLVRCSPFQSEQLRQLTALHKTQS